MTKRTCPGSVWLVCAAVGFLCSGCSVVYAQGQRPQGGGAGPADPPPEYRNPVAEIEGPSVVEGQKAGIVVGQYAADFELQPVEPYADLQKWLGADAPESIEQTVRLSQLVGKAPILLLFGSYT